MLDLTILSQPSYILCIAQFAALKSSGYFILGCLNLVDWNSRL